MVRILANPGLPGDANPATGNALWCGRFGVGEYVRLGSPDVPGMRPLRMGRSGGARIGTAQSPTGQLTQAVRRNCAHSVRPVTRPMAW